MPVDPGEDTSVEVRHEGPVAKKHRRRSSLVSSTGSVSSRNRSKSVEPREDERSESSEIKQKPIQLSRPPSSLEEARERIRVLSALTEITGGKRKSLGGHDLLEVSVVTQTDWRIEQRKRSHSTGIF